MVKRFSAVGSMPLDRRNFLKLGAGAGALVFSDMPARQAEVSMPGTIDAHAHWVPQAYADALAQLGRPTTSLHTPLELDSSIERRAQWMDAHGIQMHVLTLDGGMPWQWVSAADGTRLAQLVNDAAVKAHAEYPERFIAGIELPIRDPDLSLKELNRMAGKPGMRAIHLPNSLENRDFLFAPAYEPLWARCQELGYPVLFHPLDGEENLFGGRDRLGGPLAAATNINNTLGFPFETATTAAKFILTGVLDRFPRLEILLPHSGGCFPYIAGRIERGLTAKKFKLERPLREYVRRFHYDSLTYYPETFRFMLSLVGPDRIVIGTDDYAPMDMEDPNSFIAQLGLEPNERELILRGNAARLFRI